jgi:hypothetical protein
MIKINKIGYSIGVMLFFLLSRVSFSQDERQNYFGKNFFTNISGTYISNKQSFYHLYSERTLNIQVGIQILKPIYIGVETLSVFTNGTNVKPNNYFIKGVFLRYNLLQKRKNILFLSTSILNGDYCTCGNLDPYRENNLYYLGIEIGLNTYIAKSLFYFNATFSVNKILNEIPLKYNYNIYKLGFGYSFGKRTEAHNNKYRE